jgi:cytochrome c-type biogenesis protein CcmH
MSVKESDAGLSQNMKDKIREMLQEGMSEEEILRFFEDRYGEWILRSPKKQGFNLVLWLAPLVLLIIASLILVRTLLKRSRPAEKKQFTPLSPSEQSRLEKDLDRFETD